MSILDTVLEISIYAAIITAVMMLLKVCLKGRMSPLLHYAVWAVLIVRLILPVTFASPVHLLTIPQETQSTEKTESAQSALSPVDFGEAPAAAEADTPVAAAEVPQAQASAPVTASAQVPRKAQLKWEQMALIVWLIGAGIGFAYLAAVYCAMKAKIRRHGAPPSQRLTALFEEVKAQMGVKAQLRLVCVYEYGTPALMLPRTLLMPADALIAMDDMQVRHALRHELTHYKRGDHAVSGLLSVLTAVHWFNPAVWLAFRQVRADMETACDSAVVKEMGSVERARYASLVVKLFAQPAHRQMALGMARGNTKKTAERRVRGIFMSTKSKASGRLAAALTAAVMLVACFTTACQPTPETPIVVNKNDGVLESAIAATPEPETRYEAPETWTLDAFEANAKLTVSADAQVDVPDTGAFPVYEIVKGQYTQEQVDKIIDYFFGDETLYEAGQPQTKSELQEWLVRARLEYEERLAGATNEAGNVKYENTPEQMLESIKIIEEQIETAPETNEIQVSDGQLKPQKVDVYQYETLYVTPDKSAGREGMKYLSVMNDIGGESGSHIQLVNGNRYYRTGDTVSASQAPGIETTPEQAAQLVQDMLDSLGFDFMEAYQVEAGQVIESGEEVRSDLTGGYRVACLRRAGDFLVMTMSDGVDESKESGIMMEEEMQELYAYQWPPEELYVYVDDTGVTAIEWSSYGEIVSTISENVTLLPFAELGTAFKNAISAKYAWMEEGEASYTRTEMCITRVALSMARIQVKDAPNQWQLVPAWEFYGTYTSYEEDGTAQEYPYPDRSLLTLNAVDGSLIQ